MLSAHAFPSPSYMRLSSFFIPKRSSTPYPTPFFLLVYLPSQLTDKPHSREVPKDILAYALEGSVYLDFI